MPRIKVLMFVLIVLFSSCSPLAASQMRVLQETSTVLPVTVTALPLTTTLAPAQSETLPVATSRGQHLEASDPAVVSLASGGLQLVEFFRFT